jgi:hypothetical protein
LRLYSKFSLYWISFYSGIVFFLQDFTYLFISNTNVGPNEIWFTVFWYVLNAVLCFKMIICRCGAFYAYWCPTRFLQKMMLVSLMSNMTGVTCDAGTANPSGEPEFTEYSIKTFDFSTLYATILHTLYYNLE